MRVRRVLAAVVLFAAGTVFGEYVVLRYIKDTYPEAWSEIKARELGAPPR